MLTASRESSRVLGVALYKWLGRLTLDYGQATFFGIPQGNRPICRVMSTRERNVSDVAYMLVEQGFAPRSILPDASPEGGVTPVSLATDDNIYRELPMPMVRYIITDISPATELTTPQVPLLALSATGTTGRRYTPPIPYDAEVEIEFWCKKRYTWDYIQSWLTREFNGVGGRSMLYLDGLYPEPYGLKLLPATLSSMSDTSELEASGGEGRYIRKLLSVSVRMWDFDLDGQGRTGDDATDVGFVYGASVDTALLDEADQDLAQYRVLESGVTGRVLLDESPVHPLHYGNATTGTRLKNPFKPSQALWRLAAGQSIASGTIPVPAGTAVQGIVAVKWGVEYGTPTTPMLAEVLLYNRAADSVKPVDSATLQWRADGAAFSYAAVPGAGEEVLLRCTFTGVGAPSGTAVSSAFSRLMLAGMPVTNAVPSGDRVKRVTGGTPAAVSLTGLTPRAPYIVSVRSAAVSGSAPSATVRVLNGGATVTRTLLDAQALDRVVASDSSGVVTVEYEVGSGSVMDLTLCVTPAVSGMV